MPKKTNKSKEQLLEILINKYKNFTFSPEKQFTSVNNILKGICNTHNKNFITTYNKCIKYNPCKQCIKEKISNKLTQSNENIIKKINKIFNGMYDCSLVNYKKNKKISLICNKHGLFIKNYSDVIHQKQGCPSCSKENWKTKRTPLEIYNILNNLKKPYCYDNILNLKKISTNTKLPILCNKHGLFYQKFHNHLNQGCPYCSGKNISSNEKINKIPNNNKFEYNINKKFKSKDKIKIKCKKHNIEFFQTYNDHQQGHNGCKKCSSLYNSIPTDLKEFLDKINIKKEYNNRKLLKGKEIDIYLPEHNLGIEFNGNYWHSNEVLNKPTYHKNKTDLLLKQNINLFHIWEIDWDNDNKKEIIKSMILNKLGLTRNKIYARKCEIKEITPKEHREFLNNNHLQGFVGSKIKLGLYYNDELVSIMTFGKLRKITGNKSKENEYELLRFCNKLNTNVIGGASKLLKYFENNYKPEKIISYANRDWSNGDMYSKIGFKFVKITPPNYFYIKNNKKYNRYSFRKSELIKMGYDKKLSEKEIIKLIPNIKTIYTAGNIKYEYKNK